MLAGVATVTRRTAAALSTADTPILSHVSCTAARMSQVLTTHWAETRSLTLKNCVKFSQNVNGIFVYFIYSLNWPTASHSQSSPWPVSLPKSTNPVMIILLFPYPTCHDPCTCPRQNHNCLHSVEVGLVPCVVWSVCYLARIKGYRGSPPAGQGCLFIITLGRLHDVGDFCRTFIHLWT